MQEKRQTLLEKFDIPVSHLDFDYVKKCTKSKELERIVMILRSGEEGYFPDLTKCAEEHLRLLKPESKLFRTEEILFTKQHLSPAEWKETNEPVLDWINQMQKKDKLLSVISENENIYRSDCPPIRAIAKNIECKNDKKSITVNVKNENRIKATEYSKWDKYDADTEALKIDLDEERAREEVERMNRINLKKSSNKVFEDLSETSLKKYTAVEKEALALKFKERGNDYYRSKEYAEAVREYTQCIRIIPSAAAYNNRAMGYLKLQDYKKSIEDCDKCLEIEATNIKALLRKGQALLELNKRREAYEVYMKIISIDPSIAVAQNNVNALKKQIPELPPITATRIRIEEEDSSVKNQTKEIAKVKDNVLEKQQIQSFNTTSKKYIQEDLSQLIVPNKLVKNKLTSAVEKLGNIKTQQKNKIDKTSKIKDVVQQPEVTLLTSRAKNENKILIEEISNECI